ncbi:MAG: DUF1579 domain-containing protein [Asticcacaulis sp.]
MLKPVLIAATLLLAAPALAETPAVSTPGVSANATAIARLDAMKGVWKGEAKGSGPGGAFTLTQTERVGSMLGGDVLVVEGRGYEATGKLAFNALGIISFNAQTGAYEFRAYTSGRSGTFKFEPTATGAVWEMPAGPTARIVSTITIKGDTWHEVQDYVATGQPPRRFFEMNLKRVGDTDWPSAGAIQP